MPGKCLRFWSLIKTMTRGLQGPPPSTREEGRLDPTKRKETKSRQNPGSDSGAPPTTVLFRAVLLPLKKNRRLNTESSLVFWFPEKTQHFKASVCLRLSLEESAFEVLEVGDWIRHGFCHQKAFLRKPQTLCDILR